MKGKLDALSDAIIAIAITVLVLEINTPTSMEGMWQFAKEIFLFAQSFVVIAIFGLNVRSSSVVQNEFLSRYCRLIY